LKNIVILGSTGSIGKATLDIVRRHPDDFHVVGLSTNTNTTELARQVREFGVTQAAVGNPAKQGEFAREMGDAVRCGAGLDGLIALAGLEDAGIVVNALVGAVGVRPTLAAIEHGKRVALANKETLVMAGAAMIGAASKSGSRILPVDSEHCAVFQCLEGHGRPGEIHRILLTASGGPFRRRPASSFRRITVHEALRHPTWRMGPKITVDSATLMNKGMEVIEAHWLFGVPLERIDVVIHPQSIIHSMVEFADGSIVAQLGPHDMRLPIQYALSHPERWDNPRLPRLDPAQLQALTFDTPDPDRFPCLPSPARRANRAAPTRPPFAAPTRSPWGCS
jgi:1-deoxy-D-xylulose-5-phosphate reductoisomerase